MEHDCLRMAIEEDHVLLVSVDDSDVFAEQSFFYSRTVLSS